MNDAVELVRFRVQAVRRNELQVARLKIYYKYIF